MSIKFQGPPPSLPPQAPPPPPQGERPGSTTSISSSTLSQTSLDSLIDKLKNGEISVSEFISQLEAAGVNITQNGTTVSFQYNGKNYSISTNSAQEPQAADDDSKTSCDFKNIGAFHTYLHDEGKSAIITAIKAAGLPDITPSSFDQFLETNVGNKHNEDYASITKEQVIDEAVEAWRNANSTVPAADETTKKTTSGDFANYQEMATWLQNDEGGVADIIAKLKEQGIDATAEKVKYVIDGYVVKTYTSADFTKIAKDEIIDNAVSLYKKYGVTQSDNKKDSDFSTKAELSTYLHGEGKAAILSGVLATGVKLPNTIQQYIDSIIETNVGQKHNSDFASVTKEQIIEEGVAAVCQFINKLSDSTLQEYINDLSDMSITSSEFIEKMKSHGITITESNSDGLTILEFSYNSQNYRITTTNKDTAPQTRAASDNSGSAATLEEQLKKFSEGNLTGVSMLKWLKSNMGIKGTVIENGVTTEIRFKYNNQEYTASCSAEASASEDDDITIETYTADEILAMTEDTVLINEYFEASASAGDSARTYILKDGKTYAEFKAIVDEAKAVQEAVEKAEAEAQAENQAETYKSQITSAYNSAKEILTDFDTDTTEISSYYNSCLSTETSTDAQKLIDAANEYMTTAESELASAKSSLSTAQTAYDNMAALAEQYPDSPEIAAKLADAKALVDELQTLCSNADKLISDAKDKITQMNAYASTKQAEEAAEAERIAAEEAAKKAAEENAGTYLADITSEYNSGLTNVNNIDTDIAGINNFYNNCMSTETSADAQKLVDAANEYMTTDESELASAKSSLSTAQAAYNNIAALAEQYPDSTEIANKLANAKALVDELQTLCDNADKSVTDAKDKISEMNTYVNTKQAEEAAEAERIAAEEAANKAAEEAAANARIVNNFLNDKNKVSDNEIFDSTEGAETISDDDLQKAYEKILKDFAEGNLASGSAEHLLKAMGAENISISDDGANVTISFSFNDKNVNLTAKSEMAASGADDKTRVSYTPAELAEVTDDEALISEYFEVSASVDGAANRYVLKDDKTYNDFNTAVEKSKLPADGTYETTDENGNKVETTYKDGAVESTVVTEVLENNVVRKTTYDANGNVSSTTTTAYDENNKKTTEKIQDSNGNWTLYNYDSNGSKISGQCFSYNKSTGAVKTLYYDASGNQITAKSQLTSNDNVSFQGNTVDAKTFYNGLCNLNATVFSFFFSFSMRECLNYVAVGSFSPRSGDSYSVQLLEMADKDYNKKQPAYKAGQWPSEYANFLEEFLTNKCNDTNGASGYTPDLIEGYKFDENSSLSKSIRDYSGQITYKGKTYSSFVALVKAYKDNLSELTGVFSFSGSDDMHYALDGVNIAKVEQDSEGNIHITLADYYDFNGNATGSSTNAKLNRLGAAAMADGELVPYYMLMEITIPASKLK